MQNRKVIGLFLASPGDLKEERRAAKIVCDEFNSLYAGAFGYQFELLGWENTSASWGRPQDRINPDLERCELFVGMVWKRWGTPPDDSGRFTSGFEEEYTLAVERREKGDDIEICIFLKDVDAAEYDDVGAQLKAVTTFREMLGNQKKIYYEGFAATRDFEGLFRRVITRHVLQRVSAEQVTDEKAQLPALSNGQVSPTEGSDKSSQLGSQGEVFLHDMAGKSANPLFVGEFDSFDVARMRLLAGVISTSSNDQIWVQPHDANILYTRRHADLGTRELWGLVKTGLRYFRDENVPFWHWYVASNGDNFEELGMYAYFLRPEEEALGAIAAAKLVRQPFIVGELGDLLRRRWFEESTSTKIKVAALDYLAAVGERDHLLEIEAEIARNDNGTRDAAVAALVMILAREDRLAAAGQLFALRPTSVSTDVLRVVFDNPDALDDETLALGLGQPATNLRLAATRILAERKALTEAQANDLLNDDDAEVRFYALCALPDVLNQTPEEKARKLLVKPAASGLFFLKSDHAGELRLKRFKRLQLLTLSMADLEKVVVANEQVADFEAWSIRAERSFAKHGEALRQALDDEFRGRFEAFLESLRTLADQDTLNRWIAVEETARLTTVELAVDVLCSKGGRGDLALVRKVLSDSRITYSDAPVRFLGRFGDWADIPLITNLVGRSERDESPNLGVGAAVLIGHTRVPRYPVAAEAIATIGKNRVPELLELALPNGIRTRIIARLTDRSIARLTDEQILTVLLDLSPQIRKAMILRCITALPPKRISDLLSIYLDPTRQHYYNVIHWFDFGVSVEQGVARAAARRELDGIIAA